MFADMSSAQRRMVVRRFAKKLWDNGERLSARMDDLVEFLTSGVVTETVEDLFWQEL